MSPERMSRIAAAIGALPYTRLTVRVRQPLLHLLLQVDIEGQLDVRAELRLGFADDLAIEVVDHLAPAAPEDALADVLDAVLAPADLALAIAGQGIVRERIHIARLRWRRPPSRSSGRRRTGKDRSGAASAESGLRRFP